jgi:hypothetical protein
LLDIVTSLAYHHPLAAFRHLPVHLLLYL